MATKANLLVVDDELIVRDSLDKWFREEGYDVAVADSAHDALAKMAAKRFDLALVDIKMPGTDGVELQRRMHEIDPGHAGHHHDGLCISRNGRGRA